MPYMVDHLIEEAIVVVTLHSPVDPQHIMPLLSQTHEAARIIGDNGYLVIDVSQMLIPAEHIAQLLLKLYTDAPIDLKRIYPVVVGQYNWCEAARPYFSQHDSTCHVPLFTFLPQALTYARWRIASRRTLPNMGFAAPDSTSATY